MTSILESPQQTHTSMYLICSAQIKTSNDFRSVGYPANGVIHSLKSPIGIRSFLIRTSNFTNFSPCRGPDVTSGARIELSISALILFPKSDRSIFKTATSGRVFDNVISSWFPPFPFSVRWISFGAIRLYGSMYRGEAVLLFLNAFIGSTSTVLTHSKQTRTPNQKGARRLVKLTGILTRFKGGCGYGSG